MAGANMLSSTPESGMCTYAFVCSLHVDMLACMYANKDEIVKRIPPMQQGIAGPFAHFGATVLRSGIEKPADD